MNKQFLLLPLCFQLKLIIIISCIVVYQFICDIFISRLLQIYVSGKGLNYDMVCCVNSHLLSVWIEMKNKMWGTWKNCTALFLVFIHVLSWEGYFCISLTLSLKLMTLNASVVDSFVKSLWKETPGNYFQLGISIIFSLNEFGAKFSEKIIY